MNIASFNLLADFIELGNGIGYVTKLYVEEQLETKIIYELNVIPDTPKIEYGVILLKNNMLTSHCKLFVDYIIKKIVRVLTFFFVCNNIICMVADKTT